MTRIGYSQDDQVTRRRVTPLALTLFALTLSACLEIPKLPSSGQQDFPNRPPVLEQIPVQRVSELDTLVIALDAYDPDGDLLRYDVRGAPPGAQMDRQFGVFEWTPQLGDSSAVPYPLTFSVTDGVFTEEYETNILVQAATIGIASIEPRNLLATGGTEVTVRGIGFTEPVSVLIGSAAGQAERVVDETEMRFVTPAMENLFGPQDVTFLFPEGRTLRMPDAVTIIHDGSTLSYSPQTIPLDHEAHIFIVGNTDSDSDDEVIYAANEGIFWTEPLDSGASSTHRLGQRQASQLVVANFGTGRDGAVLSPDGHVFIWRDGQAPLIELESASATHLAVFDFEGDGDDDLLLIRDTGGATLLASVRDDFASPIQSPELDLREVLEWGDFDGDGEIDLLGLNQASQCAVSFGVGTGYYPAAIPLHSSVASSCTSAPSSEGIVSWAVALEERVHASQPV
ncbi:MAG: IPT/TIG domain-containing protein, partial [Myxococcales bacterium]|nr:IPT/TIG domain-containing protein [Myxococcales bacterium]